jgi:2Fe-2S ferredoxin
MPKVTYIQHDGAEHAVDVDPGLTLMEGSIRHNLPGIIAECGGSCSCGTCHVYVDDQWLPTLGAPAPEESELLEFIEGGQPNSRLSCQLLVSEHLDGMVVRVPEFDG